MGDKFNDLIRKVLATALVAKEPQPLAHVFQGERWQSSHCCRELPEGCSPEVLDPLVCSQKSHSRPLFSTTTHRSA